MFSFVNPTPLLEFTRSGKRLAPKPLGIWVEKPYLQTEWGSNSELGASEEDALSTSPPDLGLFIDARSSAFFALKSVARWDRMFPKFEAVS